MTDAVQERVLLVEDDDSLRQLLVEELEDRGLQVRAGQRRGGGGFPGKLGAGAGGQRPAPARR